MANNIVTVDFPEDIRKDLRVDSKGRIYTSRKGLARILGIHHTMIARVLAGHEIEPEEAALVDIPSFEGGTKFLTESQVRRLANKSNKGAVTCPLDLAVDQPPSDESIDRLHLGQSASLINSMLATKLA